MNHNAWPNRIGYRFARRALQLVSVLVYGIRCNGREHIPAEGGVLVVSNHQSHFDPPLVGSCCYRQMGYLARDTLFGFTPFAWLIESLGAVPFNREGIGLTGIKETLRRLKRGEMMLMFPEGTRTHDGEVARFRPGFTTLAVRSRAAILPVAIEGAFDVWPRWQLLPGRGTIHVRFGPVLTPDEIDNYNEQELIEEVERRVRRCSARLRQHPTFQRSRKWKSCRDTIGRNSRAKREKYRKLS